MPPANLYVGMEIQFSDAEDLGEFPMRVPNRRGVGKKCNFRSVTRHVSEKVQKVN